MPKSIKFFDEVGREASPEQAVTGVEIITDDKGRLVSEKWCSSVSTVPINDYSEAVASGDLSNSAEADLLSFLSCK